MENKIRFCPLIKGDCKGEECMWYLERNIIDPFKEELSWKECSIKWIAEYTIALSLDDGPLHEIANSVNKK